MNDGEEDRQTLTAIVEDMAKAQTADQIMRHWADDVVWFDLTAHALRGYAAVHAEFSEQFDRLASCEAKILQTDCWVNGDLGIVATVQDFHAVTKEPGPDHQLKTRQTDCFERRDGRWLLVHQHISMPSFG